MGLQLGWQRGLDDPRSDGEPPGVEPEPPRKAGQALGSLRSMAGVAQAKINWKKVIMTAAKISVPQKGWSRTRSIASLVRCCPGAV